MAALHVRHDEYSLRRRGEDRQLGEERARPPLGVARSMTLIYFAQLLLPVALVLWMVITPPRSRLGWGVQLAATLLVLWAMAHIGIWLFPPWWTPHAAAALVVAAALWAWRRGALRTAWPESIAGWGAALLFGAAGAAGAFYGARAIAGAQPPAVPVVALAWPLHGGTFMVVNGGNDLTINAHLESLVSPGPRLVPWRGNAWAVDFVSIDGFGLRATGFMPADPARYRIFGVPVLAPCSGQVVQAVGDLPDMPAPEIDRQHLAGNHVILACGEAHIVMAHFKRGSLQVVAGDAVHMDQRLADVGNSGGSNEPHLHIHAQRPGTLGAPMGGQPLPIAFGGRFLVRGERIELP